MEQIIVITETDVRLLKKTGVTHTVSLGGALDPLTADQPIRDRGVLKDALASVVGRLNSRKGCAILIPDALVFAKVLKFDKIPFSLKKRDEMIRWKMDSFLPGKAASFEIRYEVSGDSVLVAAMPKRTLTELLGLFEGLGAKCFSLVPESFHYTNWFMEREPNGSAVLLVNRDRHFSGLVIQAGEVSFVRFRKKVPDLSLRQELDLFTGMVGTAIPDRLFLFGNESDVDGEVVGNRWLQ